MSVNESSADAVAGQRPCVRLRAVEAGDLPSFFEHQRDPDAVRMAVINPWDAQSFDDHWNRILKDPQVSVRAIVADDQLAGSISCFAMNGLDYVGYSIAKEQWGRGIATQALTLLLEEVAVRPLHARVARSNAASIRVLEKNGFVVQYYHLAPATPRFPECEEAMLTLV